MWACQVENSRALVQIDCTKLRSAHVLVCCCLISGLCTSVYQGKIPCLHHSACNAPMDSQGCKNITWVINALLDRPATASVNCQVGAKDVDMLMWCKFMQKDSTCCGIDPACGGGTWKLMVQVNKVQNLASGLYWARRLAFGDALQTSWGAHPSANVGT